jgi:hypothetical protein
MNTLSFVTSAVKNLTMALGFALFGLAVTVSLTSEAYGQTQVQIEGDLSWQSRNDQRVPGSGGTLFSLSDAKQGPFPNFRVYAGHRFEKRHEIRFLYAPLQIELDTQFSNPVSFLGSTFAAGTPTTALYKFNSYRATYAYHFDKAGNLSYALGFTAKVRDAEVRLTQGALTQSKANIGFVPLLNFQLEYDFGGGWLARIDADGLAAPQGRAFDIGLFTERRIGEALAVFAGYRTIEGGADNPEVYNFAWFHKLVIGVSAWF